MSGRMDNSEIWATQLGRTFVSISQGAPEHAAAILALLTGSMFRTAAAILRAPGENNAPASPIAVDVAHELTIVGTGLYAIAAVNESGVLVQNVAEAIRGRSAERPISYNVVEGSQSTVSQTTYAPTQQGLSPAALAALAGPAALAPGAAAAAGAAAGVPLAAVLAAGGALGAADVVADRALQDKVEKGLIERGVPPFAAAAAAQAAAPNLSPSPTKGVPDVILDNIASAILRPITTPLDLLTGGRTAGAMPEPYGYVDSQPYYSKDAFEQARAAFTAKKHGGR